MFAVSGLGSGLQDQRESGLGQIQICVKALTSTSFGLIFLVNCLSPMVWHEQWRNWLSTRARNPQP